MTGIAGLHSPATGVVDFARVAAGYAEDLARAGGAVTTGCAVDGITEREGTATVVHRLGTTRARVVAVCAGAWSDRVATAAGAPPEPRIVPFRGGYLKLRPERAHLVRANIYPVPDPDLPFLGAHLTRGPDDAVLLGPSALMVGARDAYSLARIRGNDLRDTLAWPGTWRLAGRHWRTGLTELRPRVVEARLRRRGAPLRPRAAHRRLRRRAGRDPGPGGRPRRLAGRRLRRLADRAHALRAQRALPGGHLLAPARAPDRRPARAAARLGRGQSVILRERCRRRTWSSCADSWRRTPVPKNLSWPPDPRSP